MTKSKRRTGAGRGKTGLEVHWTARARRDLAQIGDYIAQDNPVAAERWVDALLKLAERAGALPHSGRAVPEIGHADIRELLLRNYRLVYRVLDKAVDVLTVFEGHRLLPRDLETEPEPESEP